MRVFIRLAESELESIETRGVLREGKRDVERLRDFGGIGELIVALHVHVIGAVPKQAALFRLRDEVYIDPR